MSKRRKMAAKRFASTYFTARSIDGGNDMEVFPQRFSFFAVKYREIVVNITQVLINSNIFRCSQYGWHFAINDSSRTN